MKPQHRNHPPPVIGPALSLSPDDVRLRSATAQVMAYLSYRAAGVRTQVPAETLQAQASTVFAELSGLTEALLALRAGPDAQASRARTQAPSDPAPPAEGTAPALAVPDLILGTSDTTDQFALFGHTVGPDGTAAGPRSEPVFLDTNGCEFFAISGTNGCGKSTALGVLIENHLLAMPGISRQQEPRAVVVFVLHKANGELLESVRPNTDPRATQLFTRYGTPPQGLPNLRRLVLPALVDEARQGHPDIPVSPLLLPPGQLDARSWQRLLCLEGHQGSQYARTAMGLLSELREGVTVARLREAMERRKLPPHIRGLFDEHLQLAARFIIDEVPRLSLIVRGGVLVVEIRDRWLTPEQRVVLAAVVLEMILREAEATGTSLLLCFDECHNILGGPLDSILGFGIKERRHLKSSLALLGQDLLGLPSNLLSLASLVMMGRNTSEANLRHHIKADPRWREVQPAWLVELAWGQFYTLTAKGRFARGLSHFPAAPRLIELRDRVSQHGGGTRTAV